MEEYRHKQCDRGIHTSPKSEVYFGAFLLILGPVLWLLKIIVTGILPTKNHLDSIRKNAHTYKQNGAIQSYLRAINYYFEEPKDTMAHYNEDLPLVLVPSRDVLLLWITKTIVSDNGP